jgi:hypothetical protein
VCVCLCVCVLCVWRASLLCSVALSAQRSRERSRYMKEICMHYIRALIEAVCVQWRVERGREGLFQRDRGVERQRSRGGERIVPVV